MYLEFLILACTIYILASEFLKQEIKDFVDRHYGMPENERLFPIVQEAVQHKMKRQMEKAGVKKIRVHDLRHSHVAYLINKGVEPILIKGKRIVLGCTL